MSEQTQHGAADGEARVHPEEVEEAKEEREQPTRVGDAEAPEGAHAAGDALGGNRMPTGNDGTAGGPMPSGDAGLNDTDDVAPEGD